MKIRRIDLKNIRGIKSETLELPEGGFAVVGPNGSGKSTWIYALEVGLYGSTPNLTINDLIHWGETTGEITVWFENSRGMFRVRRLLSDRGSKVLVEEMAENGEWVARGGAEAIEPTIRIPQSVFNEVVVKKQEDFGSFTRATPAARYKLFKDLASLEIWEKYGRKNQEVIGDLTQRISLLERDKLSAKRTIHDLDLQPMDEKQEQVIRERIEVLASTLNNFEDQRTAKLEYMQAAAKYKEAQDVIALYADAKEWLDRWSVVKDIEKPAVVFSEEELQKLQNDLERAETELATFDDRYAQWEREFKEQSDELTRLNEERDKLENSLSEVDATNHRIRMEIENLQKELDLVGQGKCPTCERRFNNAEERMEHLQSEIRQREGSLVDTSDLRDKLAKTRTRINELMTLQPKMLAARQIIDADKRKLEGAIKELVRIIELMLENKEQTQQYEAKQAFIDQYPYGRVSPEDAYQKLLVAQAVEHPGEDPTSLGLGEIESSIRDAREKLQQAKDELNRMATVDKQFRYHKKVIEDAERELRLLTPELKTHEALRDLYGRTGVPSKVISHWMALVETEANRQLDRLTEGRFSVKFVDRTATGRETIDFYVLDNLRGGERKFYSLSGGERTRVDVALALGLSNAFHLLTGIEVDTMFFDEVYGLDENGQQDFARIIESVAKSKPIMGAISCFQSMSAYFENTVVMSNGAIQRN